MLGVSRSPVVAQDAGIAASPGQGSAGVAAGQENSQQDLGMLECLMIQVSTPHPNAVPIKALFEQLSPQSRALVMRVRTMMPKVGGIFGFIKANPTAAAALAAAVGFAAEYNGATYAADYGRYIADAGKALEVVDATCLQGGATS